MARALLIPQGFAHGFQALSDDVELLYCHSSAYVPQAEAGLHAQDARLAIAWPLPVQGLSPRDAGHPMIDCRLRRSPTVKCRHCGVGIAPDRFSTWAARRRPMPT